MNEKKHYSGFESFFRRLPLPLAVVFPTMLILTYALFGIVTFTAGEFDIYLTDINVWAVIGGVFILLWAECWVGEHIRETLELFCESFDLPENYYDETLDYMFNPKKRFGVGIITGIAIIYAFYLFGFWYESLMVTYVAYGVVAILGVMVGEMFVGTIFVLKAAIKTGAAVEEQINIIDSSKLGSLKDLAGWGLQMSVIGSLVAAVIMPAIVYAPWTSTEIPAAQIAFIAMFALVIFMLLIFFIPTERIHDTMVKIKNRMEDKLSSMYRELYAEIEEIYDAGRIRDLAMEAQGFPSLITAIDKMQERVGEAPTWPFDLSQIRNLFGTILIPIGVYAIQNLALILTYLGLG